MRRIQAHLSLLCVFLCLTAPLIAQSNISIESKGGNAFTKLLSPYRPRTVSPINLSNTNRLETLIRAGKLYLSAADVIALALENNIDIEVQRYGPFLASEVLRRAKSGAALRSTDVAVASGPVSVASTGVSLTSGGLAAGTTGVTSGGGIVTQIGPALLALDPSINISTSFGHSTSAQSNTFLSQTTALTNDSRNFQVGYGQSWVSGTTANLNFNSSRFQYNSPAYSLNPFINSALDLQVTQNLLQGFGSSVNGRNIRIAKNNQKVSDLLFKQQVITTVSAVLNLYWDLVSFNEQVRVNKQALETSRRLLGDNQKQVQIGTLAPISVTQAEAEVANNEQNLLIAQTNVLQQETVLKNGLSRNGVSSPTISEVRIVPLDRIEIPEREDVKPIEDLVQTALANRPDLAQARLNIESNRINVTADKNALRPNLQAFFQLTNNGLGGQVNPRLGQQQPGGTPGSDRPIPFPDPYFVGGLGSSLLQVLRRNFPNYSAGISLNILLRNRAAQADYITDQLSLRQTELQLQRSLNQVRVDIQTALIGLRQARVRYDAAVKARSLQQQTLEAEQKKYSLGASTVYAVIQIERDLANAQGTEVTAMANYVHAQVQMTQSLGQTLEANQISVQEAVQGLVNKPSSLPGRLPEAPQ